MKRRSLIVIAMLVIALVATAGLAVGCKSAEEPNQTPPVASDDQSGEQPADQTATPKPAEPVEPDSEDGSAGDQPATTPETLTVRLYWVSAGENALGVERTVPYTKAVATAAMRELLAGPTAAEKTTWPAISTAIPAGTKLLGLTVSGGVAKVDLSGEFATGGGTFSVTARLAQVVYTLTQFPTVDSVEFYLDGVKVKTFSSEGLILDGPQRSRDYEQLLPVDA